MDILFLIGLAMLVVLVITMASVGLLVGGWKGALAFGLVTAVGLYLLISWINDITEDNRVRCEAVGGHVKTVYKGTLCLTEDGRIIEGY